MISFKYVLFEYLDCIEQCIFIEYYKDDISDLFITNLSSDFDFKSDINLDSKYIKRLIEPRIPEVNDILKLSHKSNNFNIF